MARFSIMRSVGSSGVLCALIVLLYACCGDEGIRPSNGDRPLCDIEPSTINFGVVETGDVIDTLAIITNTGKIPFTYRISTDSRHYEIMSVVGPDTLNEGDWIAVSFRFKPDTVGTVPCRIETGCGACGDIACSGVGIELSVCDIEPQTLDFDAIFAGEYLEDSFVLSNGGEGIIRGEIGESSEYYSIVTGAGPYAIGAGESVTVTVRYEPLTAGIHECTIETGTAACANVTCTGISEYLWQKIEIGTSADLYGVWGSSGTDVIAVGSGGTIVRYDGSSWNVSSSVTSFALYDVWGTSSYDIFVVGAARTLLHHNGYSWGFMNSPAAGDLYCIDGTAWNDVFAAGVGAIHYNGSMWSTSLGTDRRLTDICVHSATEAFAVDSTGDILHYNGADWSEIDSPIHNTYLSAIWGSSPDDIFVVSDEGDIFHFDGIRWRRTHSTVYSGLNSIWGSAPNDVYAVGQHFTVLHYDGTKWQSMLHDGTYEDTFYRVWGRSESDVFFVGTGGAVYHYGSRI